MSVAASVAGLVGLSIQIIEISKKFTNKKASLYDFIGELTALADVLKRLRDFLYRPACRLAFR